MNPTIPGKLGTTFASVCFGLLGVIHLAHGQGTVIFNNRVTGITVSHVYGPRLCFAGNGTNDFPAGLVDWTPFTKLSGSGDLAQLLAAAGADQPESALVSASSPATTFRTGAAAGFVSPVTATLVAVPADAPVATVQMVVWDNSSGNYPTWAQASVAWFGGSIVAGRSPKFNVYNIGGISNPPPVLTNLVSFTINYPEGDGRPWIFLQPQSQIVRAGSNVTFSVGTSFCTPTSGPYDYQWRFQGTNLAGATNSSLTINNAEFYHNGEYQVEVRAPTNWIYSPWAGQSSTSSPAILTVRPELRTGPGYGGLDNQGFHFALFAPTGMVYRIETSTNLVQWNELFWVTNNLGTSQVIDPFGAGLNRRFYRATQ